MSAAPLLPNKPEANPFGGRRFTRAEVERLEEQGFFEGRRYELIDGELIDKMGQNPRHAHAIRKIVAALLKFFDPLRIQNQSPIEAAVADRETSLPEPDVSVAADLKHDEERRFAHGEEILLASEVSDTTLRFDSRRKAVLYARAGVREYWILDINGRGVIVHRQPVGDAYTNVQFIGEHDSVSLEGQAESIRVADLLPMA